MTGESNEINEAEPSCPNDSQTSNHGTAIGIETISPVPEQLAQKEQRPKSGSLADLMQEEVERRQRTLRSQREPYSSSAPRVLNPPAPYDTLRSAIYTVQRIEADLHLISKRLHAAETFELKWLYCKQMFQHVRYLIDAKSWLESVKWQDPKYRAQIIDNLKTTTMTVGFIFATVLALCKINDSETGRRLMLMVKNIKLKK